MVWEYVWHLRLLLMDPTLHSCLYFCPSFYIHRIPKSSKQPSICNFFSPIHWCKTKNSSFLAFLSRPNATLGRWRKELRLLCLNSDTFTVMKNEDVIFQVRMCNKKDALLARRGMKQKNRVGSLLDIQSFFSLLRSIFELVIFLFLSLPSQVFSSKLIRGPRYISFFILSNLMLRGREQE